MRQKSGKSSNMAGQPFIKSQRSRYQNADFWHQRPERIAERRYHRQEAKQIKAVDNPELAESWQALLHAFQQHPQLIAIAVTALSAQNHALPQPIEQPIRPSATL